jgi:Cu(I)/Ag(I) efflux system membrane fusion protein
VIKVVELRLRFVALMAITGLVFAYWDTIWNRYEKWMRPTGDRHAAASTIEFYCPMHPQVIQAQQGTCPICGMPLAKRKKGEKVVLPAGVTARVDLSPLRVKQAGIKTVAVDYAPLAQSISTVGYVAFDERKITNIVSKVPGKSRVEKLYVNFNGQDVLAGEPLAELYSPELSQGIQEVLSAARRVDLDARQTQTAASRALLTDRRELVRLSTEKLKRWGITQAQIDGILKTGKTDITLPILSPISGHVFKKNIVAGDEIDEKFVMFEVADLSSVWIRAQIYENQLGIVHVGQPVEANVEAFPGEAFPGAVEFVQPHLDPATRTIEVRYSLDNPGHRLRSGMFAKVTLKIPVAEMAGFQPRTGPRSGAVGTRRLASLTVEQQKICPVTGAELGSMGDPIAVNIDGRAIWTCCDACPPKLKANPSKYLAKLPSPAPAAPKETTAADQKVCPVNGVELGSMGDPIPVKVDGRTIWTCCDGCLPKLKAEPAKYLARLAAPPEGQVLTVPESAVVDTGNRKLVYVEAEPGVFEGHEVVLGPRIGDRFPVLKGLSVGDKVAAAGAFLIDAESRINPGVHAAEPPANAAPSKSEKPSPTASTPEGPTALSRTETDHD